MAVGLLALVTVDGLQLILPKITQTVVDQLARGSTTPGRIAILGGAMVAVSIGMGLCRFAWRYFILGTSYRIERDLRLDLYRHLQSLSPQFYDRTKVGDLMAHATNDLGAIRMATGMAALGAIDALVLATASITIMMTMNARLTLLTLLPLPLLTLVMLRFGKVVHRRFTAVQDAFSRLTERAQESFSGIRVVKSYGDEPSEENYVRERAAICAAENIKLARAWGLFGPLIGGLATASMAILMGAGGRQVILGRLSLGQFVAFSSYLEMLIWPMMAVGWVVNILQRGTASMDRLRKLFATKPDLVDGLRETEPAPALEVSHLVFAYPESDRAVLRDVSFSLPPGQTLGIVGRTGSGKTTLVELLMRIYDPPAGTVRVGGVDVRDLRIDRLRGLYGYVPQETFLFAMSVADNIAFGQDNVPRQEIEALACQVEIHQEILAFASGYDTLLGERGVTLSGGQKQRVALARALALRPRILVLDDALSSVDTATETALLHTLRGETRDRSTIIIAHRISTVRHADTILVLDDGRVVEQGSHETLVREEGFYSELFRMQQLEEEARRTAEHSPIEDTATGSIGTSP
jgi:ATP-binding cassette, subfamily B, multidrug efflux pump